MNRLWAGAALLALLLLGGVLASRQLNRMHMESAARLEQAAQAALAEDWGQALTLQAQAQTGWAKGRRLTAALVDHEPMETIDGLFSQLEVYAAVNEAGAYAACCAELRQRLMALSESHTLALENIL